MHNSGNLIKRKAKYFQQMRHQGELWYHMNNTIKTNMQKKKKCVILSTLSCSMANNQVLNSLISQYRQRVKLSSTPHSLLLSRFHFPSVKLSFCALCHFLFSDLTYIQLTSSSYWSLYICMSQLLSLLFFYHQCHHP